MGLPPLAIVLRVLRLGHGFIQEQIAREMSGKNDKSSVSRIESGEEKPQLKKLAEIQYAFARLGEPPDPFEAHMLEAAATANWIMPEWVDGDDERARVSEIRRRLSELPMRAYRESRARRSEVVREEELERERYLLK